MRPSWARRNPVMMANSVVLPAPFGPTSATIWPSSAVNEARSSASSPPKRRVMFSTRRISPIGALRLAQGAPHADEDPGDATRRERHDQHQHAAVDHQIKSRRVAGHQLGGLAERAHDKRAEQRPVYG